ncbi:methyl-accepting chemotaxis protein [Maridesulfovibrio bastinii]|uniref:methyl-accepting chemotaxis protein n=1 Tax=Maridesulfovibrio bastinii TaxID=47157 RepID=UPI00041D371C|nr:methyl-accepting chemotaxis protein [Maridesulfovibrio bastinii]
MLGKINLRWKIMLILVVVVPVLLGITLFQESVFLSKMRENAEAKGKGIAQEYANKIDASMSSAMVSSRTIARIIEGLSGSSTPIPRNELLDVFKNFLSDHKEYLGVYVAMEPDALDGMDNEYKKTKFHNEDGRFVPWIYRSGGKINVKASSGYMTDGSGGAWYHLPKEVGHEIVMDPYAYDINGKKVLMVDMIVPMYKSGKFIGVAGVDYPMDTIDKYVSQLNVFDSGYAFLFSTSGSFVAHPDNEKYVQGGVNFFDMPEIDSSIREQVKQNVLQGKVYTSYAEGKDGETFYVFAPIMIGRATTPYILGLSIPMDKVLSEAKQLRTVMVIIGVLGVILVAVAILIISNLIASPIKQTMTAVESIADGNLDVKLPATASDEIGRMQSAVNNMSEKLRLGMEEIRQQKAHAEEKTIEAERAMDEAEEARKKAENAKREGIMHATSRLEKVVGNVSSASEEIFSRSNEILRGNEVQRDRISSTATAMEEMNATILEVAKNAGQASDQAERTRDNAQTGAKVISRTVDSMNSIQTQAESLKASMNELGEKADGIGIVMNVIEDIADQTNLLALNAAIEAARAGEAGRGFAVVADEVRKLAEKTMGATKEVGVSINSIQEVAQGNISSMEDVVSHISSATEDSRNSGEVFTSIVTDVEETSQMIRSIATAAEQQSATSEEINRSVDEINQIAIETSDATSQANNAAERLVDESGELTSIINDMKSES